MVSGNRFWLTDAQFAWLEPYLPRETRGKPNVCYWAISQCLLRGRKAAICDGVPGGPLWVIFCLRGEDSPPRLPDHWGLPTTRP